MTGVKFRPRYRCLALERPFKQLVPTYTISLLQLKKTKQRATQNLDETTDFADFCVSIEEHHSLQMSQEHSHCPKQGISRPSTFKISWEKQYGPQELILYSQTNCDSRKLLIYAMLQYALLMVLYFSLSSELVRSRIWEGPIFISALAPTWCRTLRWSGEFTCGTASSGRRFRWEQGPPKPSECGQAARTQAKAPGAGISLHAKWMEK